MPLSIRLAIRTLRGPEGWLAPLTVLSIAASVALTTALEMSSRSAQLQLERTAAAMTGAAKLEVTAGTVGIPEVTLEKVRAEPGVLAASPMISTRVRLSGQRFPINVIGLDLLADEQVRPNSITRHGLQVRDPLRLISQANAIVVTRQLLDRLELAGSWDRGETPTLRVRAGGADVNLSVQGLLDPVGIAAAFGGQVAVMDIYALQKLVHREGWFDRIDVVPGPDEDVNALSARLSERLVGVATVRSSTVRTRFFDQVVDTLRISVLIASAAGVLISSLLTYAAMTQWVEQRRRQLATLRAVGMEAGQIRTGVFVEVVVLAVIGTAIGIVGGLLLARPVLSGLSAFSYLPSAERLVELSTRPLTFVLAVLVGFVCAVAGSIMPAQRAGRRFVLDSIDQPSEIRRARASRSRLAIAGFLVLSIALMSSRVLEGASVARLSSIFVCGLALMLVLTAAYPRVLRSTLTTLQSHYPYFANMIARSFSARPLTFSISVTALAGLTAVLTTVALLIQSMEGAMENWVSASYPDAIAISAGPFGGRELLTRQTVDAIREVPGVSDVDEQYLAGPTVLFRGEDVGVVARTMSVVAKRGNVVSAGQSPTELGRALADGGVAVSLQFSRRFGVFPGERLELPTQKGLITLPVVGHFSDYGGSAGSILMDIGTFDAHWDRPGAYAALVWLEGSRDSVIEAIRDRAGKTQDLFFLDAEEVKRWNRQNLGRLTAVVNIVGGLIALLGGFAVTILLVGVISDRRRDFAVLRASGLERATLVALVFADATVIGAVAAVLGVALGLVCAAPATDILRESYGWEIEQRWFATSVLVLALGALLAAWVGGLIPARIAYRAPTTQILAPE